MLKVMVAITPLPIVVSLRPNNTQLEAPEPVLQDTDLLAAVAAGPAATLIDVKSTDEYAMVHCTAAGRDAPVEFSARFNVTLPPGTAVADERVSVACAMAQPVMVSSTAAARSGLHFPIPGKTTDFSRVILWIIRGICAVNRQDLSAVATVRLWAGAINIAKGW